MVITLVLPQPVLSCPLLAGPQDLVSLEYLQVKWYDKAEIRSIFTTLDSSY